MFFPPPNTLMQASFFQVKWQEGHVEKTLIKDESGTI